MKFEFVLFERAFKIIYKDVLQLFRILHCSLNILSKQNVQSAILDYILT